jgi:hypothetical protein
MAAISAPFVATARTGVRAMPTTPVSRCTPYIGAPAAPFTRPGWRAGSGWCSTGSGVDAHRQPLHDSPVTEPLPPKSTPRRADAEGAMTETPMAYALVHALDRAITGDMVFREPGGVSHTVTFFEGAPVRVLPGEDGDRIGEDLALHEHVSDAALASALSAASSSRRRLGEILVGLQAVAPETLTDALRMQTARRLALLANLPPETTFALYFSARAEPEPFAPWSPLDTLLATIRAWKDRSRLHGTLRWLGKKNLALADANLEGLLLTSREREAVTLMQKGGPTLDELYGTIGSGLSSLLYMLAVTRHFAFMSPKGEPLGHRRESSLIRNVQVAAPIAALVVASDAVSDAPPKPAGSTPPPAEKVAAPRADVQTSIAPPRPGAATPGRTHGELSDELRRAEEAARLSDYATADRILKERCTSEEMATPDFQAISAWVKANSEPKAINVALTDLTFVLMSHALSERALYYRALLLKRTGKDKAALRDLIALVTKNPKHTEALVLVKELRDKLKSV